MRPSICARQHMLAEDLMIEWADGRTRTYIKSLMSLHYLLSPSVHKMWCLYSSADRECLLVVMKTTIVLPTVEEKCNKRYVILLCVFFSRYCFSAVDCGRPRPIQNGSVIGEKTVYPNFMTYSCDEGFVLRGPSEIKCQTNGTWSKTSSFCEGKYTLILIIYPSSSPGGHKACTVVSQLSLLLAPFLDLPQDMPILSGYFAINVDYFIS